MEWWTACLGPAGPLSYCQGQGGHSHPAAAHVPVGKHGESYINMYGDTQRNEHSIAKSGKLHCDRIRKIL